MACIRCFIDNTYQIKLKKASLEKETFLERLQHYQNTFLDQFKELCPVKECSCGFLNMSVDESLYIKFCEDVWKDFRTKTDYIQHLFDCLIDIYQAKVAGSPDAPAILFRFLNTYCTNYSSNNPHQFANLLFRARPTGDYDPNNIYELYHIPYSKKHLVTSQRFSVAGRPMLYLAQSIHTILAELNYSFNSLNYAIYYPIFSFFYCMNKPMYNITNSIDITLNHIVRSLFAGGSLLKFDNKNLTFSKENAGKILGDSILFQILTFPKKEQTEFIEEYVLPQFFTSFLEGNGYLGLIYQSTKEIPEISEFKYKNLEYNYCFFIPELASGDYNEDFLQMFHSASIGNDNRSRSIEEAKELIKICLDLADNPDYLLDEYIGLLVNINMHVENMDNIKFNGSDYYESELGRIESTLIYQLVIKIENVVNHPENFGIMKKSELTW